MAATSLSRASPVLAAVVLGTGPGRPHPGTNPRLGPDPPEQPALGLGEQLELGVVLADTQAIESSLLGLLDAAARCLDPLHGCYWRRPESSAVTGSSGCAWTGTGGAASAGAPSTSQLSSRPTASATLLETSPRPKPETSAHPETSDGRPTSTSHCPTPTRSCPWPRSPWTASTSTRHPTGAAAADLPADRAADWPAGDRPVRPQLPVQPPPEGAAGTTRDATSVHRARLARCPV